MKRVLVVGAGEVGAKHLAALAETPGMTVVGVADPAPGLAVPAGVPLFDSWQAALEAVAAELVVVATPPGIALAAARDAAAAGAAVIVEKPVVIDADVLEPRAGDERVFVAFQPHFAPGLDDLLAGPGHVVRAEVSLAVRRDPAYFRGWRRRFATAGGVLHQQAIHGLTLALRLMPGEVETVDARLVHRRGLADTEDHVLASIVLAGGRTIGVDARVDYHGPPSHEVVLHYADGQRVCVRGRNLEAGVGAISAAPTHQQLRRRLYTEVLAAAAGRPTHPCLFPLSALRRPLEVIDHVYRDAHVIRAASAAGC
ncbi:Gfo/Idh/MocA family oxidoreductase [Nocardia wallacei]|uniref:Gfo/Idh/MocA family oxidoreductase n=1 Tax=Nocardia wallacei TaxID=480035 RepID=UPI002458A217|nr:Gfo/Idh/MocA family oxidoreductase [Nocardia wallacei]